MALVGAFSWGLWLCAEGYAVYSGMVAIEYKVAEWLFDSWV